MLTLNGNTLSGSTLCAVQGEATHLFTYSGYGSCKTRAEQESSAPGFNGQRLDPINAVSHLGNGYRAYSPALMRFTCPDSLSPFDRGGLNPYVYCGADPVNHIDPSGHCFLITFFASLFSSIAAATTEALGTAAAAVGAEAGVAAAGAEAGVAGAEAGVAAGTTAAMTTAEYATATSVASTSAAFGGTGTAVGIESGAGIASVATASGMATASSAATLGTVNAAIGTAMQASKMSVGAMAGLFVGSGVGAASFYGKMGKHIEAMNAASLTEASLPEGAGLYQAMSILNTNPLILTPKVTTAGYSSGSSAGSSNDNRALSSAAKPGAEKINGTQGTPSRQKYLQTMGYHLSRLQTNTVPQSVLQSSLAGEYTGNKNIAEAPKVVITGSGLFGMSNRELRLHSYKSANFQNSAMKKT